VVTFLLVLIAFAVWACLHVVEHWDDFEDERQADDFLRVLREAGEL
jgi:fumarate reductase subunit D